MQSDAQNVEDKCKRVRVGFWPVLPSTNYHKTRRCKTAIVLRFWSGIWEGLGWAVLTWGFPWPYSQISVGLWLLESSNGLPIQNGSSHGRWPTQVLAASSAETTDHSTYM